MRSSLDEAERLENEVVDAHLFLDGKSVLTVLETGSIVALDLALLIFGGVSFVGELRVLVFLDPSESLKVIIEDRLLLVPLNANFAAIDDVVDEEEEDFLDILGFCEEEFEDFEKSSTCGCVVPMPPATGLDTYAIEFGEL